MNDLQEFLPRLQTSCLQQLLRDHPVVVLHGARQTGKTTLAQSHAIGGNRFYSTLDDMNALDLARRDPFALLVGHERVTLDEIQRQPDVLLTIKADVDRRREPGRFLLTGSANLLLMEKVSESLAGRAVYLDLPPLTWAEMGRGSFGGVLDRLLASGSLEAFFLSDAGEPPAEPSRPLSAAILAGGYPVPALSEDLPFRTRWFDGYLQTYLERDLRNLSGTDRLVEFRRFMRICASRNGSVLNLASLARDAGLSPATARRYLNLMEVSFQISPIPAYAVNRGKRLIKSPKIYWTDTGLAAHLAGIHTSEVLTAGREWGAWLENWVGIHLQVYASLKSPRAYVYHWRTSDGHEVDFIVESGRRLLPIEVKAVAHPSMTDLRSMEVFLRSYPDAPFGVLACQCDRPTVMSSRTVAIPLTWLLLS